MKADLVPFAMGFVHPVAGVFEAFGVERDGRQCQGAHRRRPRVCAGRVRNQRAEGLCGGRHASRPVAGGVWAIREGRRTPPAVDHIPDGIVDAAAPGANVQLFANDVVRGLPSHIRSKVDILTLFCAGPRALLLWGPKLNTLERRGLPAGPSRLGVTY